MRKHLKMGSVTSLFCLLALCSVLAACGAIAGRSTTSTVVATHAPTPTLTLTPTPTITFTHLSGDGYTITYPSNWGTGHDTVMTVFSQVISDPNTINIHMTILSGGPSGGSAQGYLNSLGQEGQNFQPKRVPGTVTIDGVQWEQAAGTLQDSGTYVPSTLYVLKTFFPSDTTKPIFITYTAPTSKFDQINAAYFQPMLLSFKFT